MYQSYCVPLVPSCTSRIVFQWSHRVPVVLCSNGPIVYQWYCVPMVPSCTSRIVFQWSHRVPVVLCPIGPIVYQSYCVPLVLSCTSRIVSHWSYRVPVVLCSNGPIVYQSYCVPLIALYTSFIYIWLTGRKTPSYLPYIPLAQASPWDCATQRGGTQWDLDKSGTGTQDRPPSPCVQMP